VANEDPQLVPSSRTGIPITWSDIPPALTKRFSIGYRGTATRSIRIRVSRREQVSTSRFSMACARSGSRAEHCCIPYATQIPVASGRCQRGSRGRSSLVRPFPSQSGSQAPTERISVQRHRREQSLMREPLPSTPIPPPEDLVCLVGKFDGRVALVAGGGRVIGRSRAPATTAGFPTGQYRPTAVECSTASRGCWRTTSYRR
jgi:hypothetical protein